MQKYEAEMIKYNTKMVGYESAKYSAIFINSFLKDIFLYVLSVVGLFYTFFLLNFSFTNVTMICYSCGLFLTTLITLFLIQTVNYDILQGDGEAKGDVAAKVGKFLDYLVGLQLLTAVVFLIKSIGI